MMSDTLCDLSNQISPGLVQSAMDLIRPARRIALLAHEHPDGDCIGSALGLAHILQQMGKTAVPICADPPPKTLAFLPGIGMLQRTLDDEDYDLVFALDAGELSRFGPVYERHKAFLDSIPIINIDHHISSSGCGLVNIIDPTAAATSELIVLFQQQANLPLNKDAAVCLLTGIITDTSSFQFTNTTPRCLEVAALLLQAGAIPEPIVQHIYRSYPLAQLRFQASVIDNAQVACNGRLMWSYATAATLAKTGATADMDDNSSGMMRDVEGVQVAAFFKSYGDPGITRLSLRSAAPYNAAEICQRFGGGGHARAAGATLQMPIEAAMRAVVSLLKEIMGCSQDDEERGEAAKAETREGSGILNINKAVGMTSHDVVAKVRRLLKQKRVGHTGTLDPLASGVLPICIGQATRVAAYLSESGKAYLAEIVFGAVTDTYDAEGTILRTSDASQLSLTQIESALPHFLGEQMQVPPRYSAIKLKGQPAYKLARAGEEIALEPRPVTISRLDIHAWQPPRLTLAVECSKGTYIRSLAYDLGERLGYGAYLAALTRTRSGPFTLSESITLEQLAEAVENGNLAAYLHPIDSALQHLPALSLDAATAASVLHGNAFRPPAANTIERPEPGQVARVYAPDDQLLAIAAWDAQQERWQPTKVFTHGS